MAEMRIFGIGSRSVWTRSLPSRHLCGTSSGVQAEAVLVLNMTEVHLASRSALLHLGGRHSTVAPIITSSHGHPRNSSAKYKWHTFSNSKMSLNICKNF